MGCVLTHTPVLHNLPPVRKGPLRNREPESGQTRTHIVDSHGYPSPSRIFFQTLLASYRTGRKGHYKKMRAAKHQRARTIPPAAP